MLGPNTLLLQIASRSASSTTLDGVLFDCFSTIELVMKRTTLQVGTLTPYEGATLLTEHNLQAASKGSCTIPLAFSLPGIDVRPSSEEPS